MITFQVRERCRKVTEEKQILEEKLLHKEEECQALKQIVILSAQKDGNINDLINAADSNLFMSKVRHYSLLVLLFLFLVTLASDQSGKYSAHKTFAHDIFCDALVYTPQ